MIIISYIGDYDTIIMTTDDKKYFWRNTDPLWCGDAVISELHVRAFYDEVGEKAKDED